MSKSNINEINTLILWAEDTKRRLGKNNFSFEVIKKCVLEEYNLHICFFSVKSNVSATEVKKAIRIEADKYKEGRLYFMVYNDIEELMILLFYSFRLPEVNIDSIEDVELVDINKT